MEINKIEEAKKYIGKIIFTISDQENRGKYKVIPLYVGGVFLHYNQVNYDVEGFSVWEDKRLKNYWGKIEKDRIAEKFKEEERHKYYYFTSETEAEKYKIWQQKDEIEQEKEYDIKNAKKLLEKHKVKFEIFN